MVERRSENAPSLGARMACGLYTIPLIAMFFSISLNHFCHFPDDHQENTTDISLHIIMFFKILVLHKAGSSYL